MTFHRHFLLVMHFLGALGVAAVAVTNQVSTPFVLAALFALGWSLFSELRRSQTFLGAQAANAAMVVALAVTMGPFFLGGGSLIGGIAEFLLVLTALKALAVKGTRDWLQVISLALFQLVAASALTIEPVFALVFVAFLVVVPWALALFHLRREAEAAGEERRLREEPFVDISLFRGVAGVSVIVFLFTITLFIVFPRAGAGYFAAALGGTSGVSGFSDQLTLGDVSALKLDDSVAMRVSVNQPARLRGELYWRGAVLDEFDGHRWRRSDTGGASLVERNGLFLTGTGTSGHLVVRQNMTLEPTDTPALLSLGRPIALRGRIDAIVIDDLGNLRGLWDRSRRLQYEVNTILAPANGFPTPASRALPTLDPRIIDLAGQLVRGRTAPSARAVAILGHLFDGYEYSLEPGDPGDTDPLAHFLFETRVGHCEYFASSMAILLRVAGIPSRIVNGYAGGEWNEYGEYFLVRQSHAHSWVEGYLDGEWVRFDPTPAVVNARSEVWRRLAAMSDAYRMRWYRYVVNYGIGDQMRLAFSIRNRTVDSFRSLGEGLDWQALWAQPRRLVAIACGGLALVFLLFWARRRSRIAGETGSTASLPEASRLYVQALRKISRQGLDKRVGETADDFAERAALVLEEHDAATLERLTALYQRERFGADPSPAANAELSRLAKALGKRPTTPPPGDSA